MRDSARVFGIILLAFIFCGNGMAQVDSTGSGRALLLDGANDYVDFGSNYHSLNLPFTISAWIYLDPLSGAAPIFVTNDNDTIYRGFWLFISPTSIWCEFGDGTGGNNPAFRRGKQIFINNVTGRWIHICAVMTSPFDINLYMNGVDVGGSSSGGSQLSMASSFPGDIVKTGYFEANGGVIYYYKGMIDEIRLWNRSLTSAEVRQDMCKKLTGNELGLVGYWNFDETSGNTVFDKSINKFNGQFHGNPQRVYSGAPIGDDSKYLYNSNWTGATLSMMDGIDQVTVSNIQGSPEGVHLYEVKNFPSQTGGLDASTVSKPYFGVFEASLDVNNSFDVAYSYLGSASCKMFSRSDNGGATWSNSNNPLLSVSNRDEVIRSTTGQAAVFDLGADKILCNQLSTTLSTGIIDPQFSILWNTGQTTSSINVTQSGKYVVKVAGLCGNVRDSVSILFESTPQPISLGDDQSFCVFAPITLNPLANSSGYQFIWQDNSSATSFQAKDFGKYWVSVKNDCGVTSDTIIFSKYKQQVNFVPNVITPNGDAFNQYFKVDEILKGNVSLVVLNRWGKEVYRSVSYENDWDGGGLSPGVYYIVLSGPCIDEIKSSLTIIH